VLREREEVGIYNQYDFVRLSASGRKTCCFANPFDGAGKLISGSVGGMRQLRELPRISALRFAFPTVA
jgi:hypothetical protein